MKNPKIEDFLDSFHACCKLITLNYSKSIYNLCKIDNYNTRRIIKEHFFGNGHYQKLSDAKWKCYVSNFFNRFQNLAELMLKCTPFKKISLCSVP